MISFKGYVITFVSDAQSPVYKEGLRMVQFDVPTSAMGFSLDA